MQYKTYKIEECMFFCFIFNLTCILGYGWCHTYVCLNEVMSSVTVGWIRRDRL